MRHVMIWAILMMTLWAWGCREQQPVPPEGPGPDPEMAPAPVDAAQVPPLAAAAVSPAPESAGAPVDLFNGRDLTGWTYELRDPDVKMEEVWSVQDGVLFCKGQPYGYLRTLEDYENYVLTLEWRWPPGTPGGNNGVLVHTSTPGAIGIWPRSIEVQLHTGNAGDFWIIGTELEVENNAERWNGERRYLKLLDAEKPLGEWNHMEITCRGDEIIVKVNGQLVNHAFKCNVTRGAIALQSEGAPIEYRNIRLTPLPAPAEL